MSKAKDRARAESGLIFRNGSLVNRQDWCKAHPTPEMRAAQQAQVDKAIEEERLRKALTDKGVELPHGGGILVVRDGHILDPKDTNAVLAEAIPNRYYCTACRKHHVKTSKVGQEHLNFYLAE